MDVPGAVETQLTPQEVHEIHHAPVPIVPILRAGVPFEKELVDEQFLSVEAANNDIRVCYGDFKGVFYYQVKGLCIVRRAPLYVARNVGGIWRVVHGTKEYRPFREIEQLHVVDGTPLYVASDDHGTYVVYGSAPLVRSYRSVSGLHFRDGFIRFYGVRHANMYRVTIPKP